MITMQSLLITESQKKKTSCAVVKI